MSHSSSFKNAPLQKQQIEKAWETLRHPFSLAVLASLGVHTLLWFGLPLLPSSASKQPDQRTLNVVELSPLEQARLPQTAIVPPAAPLPDPFKTPVLEIPSAPANPTVTDSPTSSTDYYPVPGLDSSSTSTQTPKKSATQSTQDKSASDNSPKTDSETKAEASDEDTPKTDELSTDASKLGAPISKSRDDQDKQLQALQQKYAYSSTGTSPQDYNKSMGIAGDQITEKFGKLEWEKPIKTGAAYPKEACQFQHDGKPIEGTTGLAVVLQPDGALAEKTWMFKSSGFKGLDEAAAKFLEKEWSGVAKRNEVEPGTKPKAFTVEVNFKPGEADCAGVAKTS